MMQYLFAILLLLLISRTISRCDTSSPLDIIFLVDSSGSVYDDEFKQWQAELTFVADIVSNALPINSRASLINFSGCGTSMSFEQCKQQGRLNKMFTLNDYGSPNDLNQLLTRIQSMGPEDFLGGYTWTNEALTIALNEFNYNSTNNTNKMIVLITDGEPFPYNQGHEPCNATSGYMSPTLVQLRDELDVEIVTVGINMNTESQQTFFDCIRDDDRANEFYFDATFNSLYSLSDNVGEFICNELTSNRNPANKLSSGLGGNTGSGSSVNTLEPTPKPTSPPIVSPERCDSEQELDIMFIIDSSGSVYDNDYNNWQNELDLVAGIISNVLPENSRAGLINFSGCGAAFNFEQCKEQNRLNKMIGFNDYGIPNDLGAVYDRIQQIGPDDFLGGYTWTNEALTIALNEFNANSTATKQKFIVLITDGEPFPYNQGHEACNSTSGYVSTTLLSLRELGVNIVTVGIDVTEYAKEEWLDCIANNDDRYFDTEWVDLVGLTSEIGELICDSLEGGNVPDDGTILVQSDDVISNTILLSAVVGLIAVLFYL